METEIEKLKQLRADREKMKQRQETTLVTRRRRSRGGNDATATVCPSAGASSSFMIMNVRSLSVSTAVLFWMMILSTAGRNGGRSIMISG